MCVPIHPVTLALFLGQGNAIDQIMSELSIDDAREAIYTSVNNDNEDIDIHIDNLKAALTTAGTKEIDIDPERLNYNNRTGRKMMQSYFKKRGIIVKFKGA